MAEGDAAAIEAVERSMFYEFLTGNNDTWAVVSLEYGLDDEEDLTEEFLDSLWSMYTPDVRGNRSPTARWQPMSPGLYTLEFAASDGCQIGKGPVNVVAHCPGCDPVASICQTANQGSTICVLDSQDALMWQGGDFASMHFYAETYFDESVGVGSRVDHQWGLESTDKDIVRADVAGNSEYYLQYTTGEDAMIAQGSDPGEAIEVFGAVTLDENVVWTDRVDDISTEDLLFHPDFYYHAKRIEYERDVTTTTVSTSTETWTYATTESRCTISLDAIGGTVDDTDRISISVEPTGGIPQDCEGTYQLLKDTWDTCRSEPDDIPIVVDCGPDPVAFIDCIPEVYFDYDSNPPAFSDITLRGGMSFDLNNLPLDYRWTVTDVPEDSEFIEDTEVISFNPPANAVLFLDNRAGDYEVMLEVDNGCRSDIAYTTISAFCDDPPIARLYFQDEIKEQSNLALGVPLVTLHFDGKEPSKTLLLNSTASYSDFDHGFTTSWKTISTPPIDWDALDGTLLFDLVEASTNELEGDVVPFVAGYLMDSHVGAGVFEIQLRVEDGCEIGTFDFTIELECETSVRTDSGADIDVFLDQDGGRVYLSSSGTSFNYADPSLSPDNFTNYYEWEFISWPEDCGAACPPELDDDDKLIYNLADLPAFVDPADTANGGNIYDPITNPGGTYSVIPDRFVQSGAYDNLGVPFNEQHISHNPATIADSTSFRPPIVGDYVLKLLAWDGCRYDATDETDHLTVRVFCQDFVDPTANFPFLDPPDASDVYTAELTVPIRIFGDDPNDDPFLNIEPIWSVVDAPVGSECYPVEDCVGEDWFSSLDTLDTSFFPDAVGIWVIELVLKAPVCGEASETFTIDVVCDTVAIQLNNAFDSSASNNQVVWMNGKFDKVEVWGSHGAHADDIDYEFEVDYFWDITLAEDDSAYYPICYESSTTDNHCTETIPLTITSPDVIVNNGENTTITTTVTDSSVETDYYSFVRLAPIQDVARYEEYDRFLACFFPDVPGTYVLELTVLYNCAETVAVQALTINAACNEPPSISALCTSCDGSGEVILTGSKFARVQLDGTGTSDLDAQAGPGEPGDRIEYWWAWTEPDFEVEEEYEWYDYVENNVVILNRNQPLASFLITISGEYSVTLWVSDGCTIDSQVVVINAVCDANSALDLGTPGFIGVPVEYDDIEAVSWLSFDLAPYSTNPTESYCAQDYSWELIEYTVEADVVPVPSPPSPVESGVTSIRPSFVMAGLALIVYIFI